jgi:molybdate transport system substrate-binding protein
MRASRRSFARRLRSGTLGRIGAVLAVALALALATAGCGSRGGIGAGKTLTVFAAASLKAAFSDIGTAFEAGHPGVRVIFDFAGSSDLAQQIRQGAPADVFASADLTTMAALGDAAINPQAFATNTLMIAVPPANPSGITSFADLAKPGVRLVICAPQVPCGAATAKVADAAGITLRPVSMEQSVTDVLGKVSAGEADAGVVYVTDVMAAGNRVKGIAFPEASSAVNTYPIARLTGANNADLAEQFVEFVLGDTGKGILAAAGFGAASQ